MISVGQIRAARAMLNIKQKDLADKAGISIATLNNIERGVQLDPKISTMHAIQGALEKSGIEFITNTLGGVGVCLKPKHTGNGYATILIVDDNKADRTLYKNWLGKSPAKKYRIVEAENARAGFDAYIEHQPDCVILDFMMYGADGFQLLAALKREQAKLPPIIFVTGMHNEILEDSAKSQGVHAYLNKQLLNREEFVSTIESALAH